MNELLFLGSGAADWDLRRREAFFRRKSAALLNGHLLLVHGLADDNVHFRNAAEYTEALVQADKDFRELTYTNRNHGIFGGNTRAHLFRQITNHFKQYLQ